MRAYCNGKYMTVKLQGKRVNIASVKVSIADFITSEDELFYTSEEQAFKTPTEVFEKTEE